MAGFGHYVGDGVAPGGVVENRCFGLGRQDNQQEQTQKRLNGFLKYLLGWEFCLI